MTKTTFPARFEYLDEIRDLVAQTAHEGGFTEKVIYSLQLAADEAASILLSMLMRASQTLLLIFPVPCRVTRS
jgi:hypothetical protein